MSRPGSPSPLSTATSGWRCVICDKTTCKEKKNCEDYKYLLERNLIRVDSVGHALWPDGAKIPTNRGNGGIVKTVKEKFPQDKELNARAIQLDVENIGVYEEDAVVFSAEEISILDDLFDAGDEEKATAKQQKKEMRKIYNPDNGERLGMPFFSAFFSRTKRPTRRG